MAIKTIAGDALERLRKMRNESVHCCVTSPPYYGLRDYGVDGQIGLEETPDDYVANLVDVFREVRRVLRDDGTFWLNLGDSYAANRPYQVSQSKHRNHDYKSSGASRVPDGLKPKDLIGIPWMVAFALRADGWYLRDAIVWHKPNPMPESVKDRCTSSYEMVFMLAKSARYYFDADAIAERSLYPGDSRHLRTCKTTEIARPDKGSRVRTGNATGETRNSRNVWSIATKPYSDAHFAVMAPDLAERCILAGCPKDGTVLDPFGGAGTTGIVADRLQRNAVLIELNPEYVEMMKRRIEGDRGGLLDIMENDVTDLEISLSPNVADV